MMLILDFTLELESKDLNRKDTKKNTKGTKWIN